MNKQLFKSKMAFHDDTYISIANELKIHRNTLGEKVDGKSQFTQKEIDFFINHWNLTPHDVVQIFFDKE